VKAGRELTHKGLLPRALFRKLKCKKKTDWEKRKYIVGSKGGVSRKFCWSLGEELYVQGADIKAGRAKKN